MTTQPSSGPNMGTTTTVIQRVQADTKDDIRAWLFWASRSASEIGIDLTPEINAALAKL